MDNSSFQGQPLHYEHATNSQPTNNCSTCNKPSGTQFIICNKCHKSYHYDCAKISNNQQTFTCNACSKETKVPDSPKSVSSHRSNASNSSINSIVRKRNLELKRLEEERQLAIERDREFLKQKYQLLQQAEEDSYDTNSVVVSSVHEWLNNQTQPAINNAENLVSDLPNLCETDYIALPSNNAVNLPKTPIENHNSNSTTNNVNPYPNEFQGVEENALVGSVQNNFQNKTPHVSLSSTFHNNTTTFINSNAAPSTTTAIQTNNSSQASAIDTVLPSFSSVPRSSINPDLTCQQINARQTVPKDLPTFTGNPEEWPLFSSTYDWSTTVCGLTDAENLIRLQKALRGDALQSVQQILIHPSCVSAAISTLKLLYGQPEKILNSLKMKIRSLPTINTKKLDTITSFAVQVKGLQATIEACGLLDELNNSSLLQELISKLPSYFQINWGTYKMNLTKQNKKVNLAEFSDWIFDIGVSASSVNIDNNLSSAAETLSRSKQRNVFIHTHTEQSGKNCIVCGGDCNNIANCQKFKTADRTQKWNIVREFKLCKQCLRKHFGACNNTNVCGIDNCQFKHHYLLHKTNEVDQREASENNQIHSCNIHSASSCYNLFKIIPITIYGNETKFIETFAFIDDGSSTSLIDEQIINDLNLSGDVEPLCLKWTGNVERNEENSRRLCVNVSGPNKKIYSAYVRTVKHLSLSKQTINIEELIQNFPYLKDLPLTSYVNATPRLLIGLNNSRLCVYKRVREGKINEPIAIRTRLGWLVYGTTKGSSLIEDHHCHISEFSDTKLYDLMKKFYCLETSGINNKTTIISKDDEKAVSILQKYTKQRLDGHYETSLLWRNEDVEMPNSYDMAKKRFLCLEKKLKNDSCLNDVFNKTMAEYVSKGYITKVDNHNLVPTTKERVWYLPIFAVSNRNKPRKFRIVWDAAANSHGVSLNSMLMKGPDLLCSLPSILIRFRQRAVAICGDIEQMFHQIYIRKEDRNVQRFLWRNYNSKELEVYVMNVMIFGASCAPCISQYVKNMNAEKFQEKYPIAAASIKQNHYVDDFLDSVDSVEEAISLATDVKYIHSKAGFNIRNWLSNNKNVLNELNEKENRQQKSLNLGNELDADKVLGVFWKLSDDTFTFKLSPYILDSDIFTGDKTPTKRELLKILMTIYDPLGLIGHYLMYLKIVLQEVWRSGVGWDVKIYPPQMIKWSKWLLFLPEIQNIIIPRCYLKTFQTYNNLDVQLHTFADASENGYAAVSYLRISKGSDVVVSLVGSKTRVAPLRITSIPRLELMAALIASRFANSIVNSTSIKINQRVFWSDSKTVISWLRSDHRRYHQFVAFRVSEILDTTELNEWQWISGKLNVADEATKWSKGGPNLSNSSRWQNGPDFLKQHQSLWPLNDSSPSNTDCELKQHILHIDKSDYLVNIKRFSQWRRALRSIAYVIHYINKLKNAKVATQNYLSQNELKMAEIVLVKQAQKEAYLEELVTLRNGGKISKGSTVYKLSPYLDCDEVLRIDGRIDNANVPDELKHPAIMPKNSYITSLIILHFHTQYHHGNHETAINEIRQKYYVPRLRTIFRKVIKECQMCKVKKAQPIYPQMAKLPRARLSAYHAPFTFTGLDFFGPILVTVNRHKEKRYGALFTCLTIRAVHVEIVHSLNTNSCILAIRNFMARRGTPREFFSDNGTNFVGAERELREAVKEVDSNEFVRNFTTATTKWNFNTPAAPHMGGAWERMVRSIKTVLYKIVPSRSPNDETLRSMMAEVENIINSRPLTYVPIDDENQEALTPNHLLLGCSNGMKPLANYNDSGLVLKNSWLYSQQYAQQFWKKWLAEYLPSLTCRTKWFEKSRPLNVGDLVVVVDPSSPRNVWPKGKVMDTTVAEDGQVRSATIATTYGVLERPVAKLALLDVAQVKE